MSDALLLDTNAIVYLATGAPMRPDAIDRIAAAAGQALLLVSPISAWEIGNVSRPKNSRRSIDFLPDPTTWFRTFMTAHGVVLTPFSPEIGIAAAYLPEGLHGDPADRLLTATARALGAAMVTRDRDILAYAEMGHVRAIAC